VEEFDVAIVGSGPAGLSAAIYACRRALSTVIFERKVVGGEATLAPVIENYPGVPAISGVELASRMEEHAKSFSPKQVSDEVRKVEKPGERFIVSTQSSGDFSVKAVILATGTNYRHLGVPGEKEFGGKGVSYCATCDAPFFRKRTVAVIGGGNSALTTALMLSDIAAKTYLVHRKAEFRGEETLQKRVRGKAGIELIMNSSPKEIKGDKFVTALIVEDNATKKEREIALNGVFVNIGMTPGSELAKSLGCELDEAGYAKADTFMRTNVPGVFVAGDLTGGLKQVVTAAAKGAAAATSAYLFIKNVPLESIGY